MEKMFTPLPVTQLRPHPTASSVNWLGNIERFLSTSFLWLKKKNGGVLVHMSQSAFAQHTVICFGLNGITLFPNGDLVPI